MKKNLLLFFLILFSIQAMSQEKGLYLTLSGGIGPTGFRYKMTDVNFADPNRNILLGGQVGLGASYYFTKHVGVSLGLGVSHYRTKAKLMGNFEVDNYFVLGKNYTDNDPFVGHLTNYELRVRTQDWVEFQSSKFFEIPVTLNLQKKFGEKEGFGLYLAVGAKFQIPFNARYEVIDGENAKQSKLNVSGYYEEHNLELGRFDLPDLSSHGFGKIYNPSEVLNNAKGKLDMKFNIALVGEAGILISLSRRVDLSLGAFIDYGLLNVNKHKDLEEELFIGPDNDYVTGAEKYKVAEGISYNPLMRTKYVHKVSTFSYGGKVGIRVKLGKLSVKEEQKQEPVSVLPPRRDTVFLQPPVQEQPQLDSLLKAIMDALDEALKQKPVAPIPQPILAIPKQVDEMYDYYPGVYADEDMAILFEPVYFDLDKATLKPESIRILDNKVIILKKYPEIILLVYGNTCDLGKDTHNLSLGQRRADAAKNYLISKGIEPKRFETSTMSKFNPELPNINEENRQHNRRDDFKPLFLKR